ncbi:glycosyltransferase family 2 protein [Anaerophaga thermohalophila]|uniref:glycosyltransferase family 2 protein n=1 Tax=Anaerophaga thermohalophila TaxID=177400 RepID=UPI0003789FC7|nr:glycosyltransferase [Anaerophaga thermohalophila]
MISVIIPTFNCAHMIIDTLNSVLASIYPDYEILIIDDGSTDNTREVTKPYLKDHRIQYIYQENKGLAGARNTGILNAQGHYLVFLDADDLITPEKLGIQSQFLVKNPNIDIVYSNSQWFIEDDFNDTRPVNFPVYTGNVLDPLIFGNFIHVNSAMVRKKTVMEAGLFDESLEELEDWDLWLRMALNGSKFGFTPGVLSKVRIRKGSMTSNQQKMNNTMVRVLENTILNVQDKYHSGHPVMIKLKHSLAIYKLKAGQKKEYLNFLIKSSRQQGEKFLPVLIKQSIKYFLYPFFRENKTTREIEKIWKQ